MENNLTGGKLIKVQQKEINVNNYQGFFWTKAIEAVIIALVVLTPIVFYPYCITVFIPAKEFVAEVLILISFMFWTLKMIDREEIGFTASPLNLPVLGFIIICIFSLIWSNNLFASIKELPLFLAGPLLYFVVTNNIIDGRQIRRILNALLIVGSLFGIYGILQYNGIDFSLWIRNIGRQQVFGLFGNVNYFAEYLIVPLPIAVSLFFVSRNKFKKTLLLIGIMAMGASLITTFTRSSYFGFGVSLVFMFFLFLSSRGNFFVKENKKIFVIILIALLVTTFLFVIPNPLNKQGTAIFKIKSRISVAQISKDFSLKRRIATWKFTALMIKDHPLIGSGIGTFKYNTLKYQANFFDQGENRTIYPYGFAGKAHNEYLQLWAETGIVGLLIFIWLMISYFSYGIKALNKTKDNYKLGIIIGLMGSVMAVLADGIFGFPLHLPATVVLFWLSLGFTIAIINSKADAQGNNITNKDLYRKIKEKRGQIEQEIIKDRESNISRFKPLLYIGIILLTAFLCVTVSRPFVARTYWYYADKEIENKNWNKAIKINEKALKWDPYLGQIYFDIGIILHNINFPTPAMEYFEKAEKYVDLPNLPQALAFVYLDKGLLNKAVAKLEQAISYQSDEKSMLPLYIELGKTYMRINKYELAETALKNALKIDSNSVNGHFGLANIYLHQDKLQDALKEFQEIVKIAPDATDAEYSEKMIKEITEKLDSKSEEWEN